VAESDARFSGLDFFAFLNQQCHADTAPHVSRITGPSPMAWESVSDCDSESSGARSIASWKSDPSELSPRSTTIEGVTEGRGGSSSSATSDSSGGPLGSRDIEVFVDDEIEVSHDFFNGMWDAGLESPTGMEFPPPLPKMLEADLRAAWPAAGGQAPDMLAMCLCPITHEVMREPVIAADGMTYDREAIMKWFLMCDERGTGPVSPVTNQPLSTDYIVPNHTTRSLLYSLQDMANSRQVDASADAGTQTVWSPVPRSRSSVLRWSSGLSADSRSRAA